MSSRKLKTYQATESLKKLYPEVSANTLNGLGEKTRRRATQIYWNPDPDKIMHGALQQYIVDRYMAVPVLHDVYARKGVRGPGRLDPVAEQRVVDTPGSWTARIKEFALNHEADLVGVARMQPEFIYEGFEEQRPWIIVLGLVMHHARLAAVCYHEDVVAALEVADQYNRGSRASRHLANWIRAQGYSADAHAGPWAGSILLLPAAIAAGFGELGKHGSIINRDYGSSFRLAGVVTDLPLMADEPDAFGADEFCHQCQVCTNTCPPDAIFRTKQSVRGVTKWYVDFDKCISYFAETHGCGICIAECPWSRPGVALRLTEKLARRRARRAQLSEAPPEGQ